MVSVAEGVETDEQAPCSPPSASTWPRASSTAGPEPAERIDALLAPPDPDAPFTGPADDTSVFPPPVFPRDEPPAAPPAEWPAVEPTPEDAAQVEVQADAEVEAQAQVQADAQVEVQAGAADGAWPDPGGPSSGRSADPAPPRTE